MDQFHCITLTPNSDSERGQHLKFEEKCTIKTLRKLGYSLRVIAKAVALNGNPFVDRLIQQVLKGQWSIDACVGYAHKNELFPKEFIVCTKTIYNAV